jgi:hypothetical protein
VQRREPDRSEALDERIVGAERRHVDDAVDVDRGPYVRAALERIERDDRPAYEDDAMALVAKGTRDGRDRGT